MNNLPYYPISRKTKKIATLLGVKVRPSTDRTHKIDVLDWNGNFICSIGDLGYSDYFLYTKLENWNLLPKGTARKRRMYYIKRHHKEANNIGSKGYYALALLWDYIKE